MSCPLLVHGQIVIVFFLLLNFPSIRQSKMDPGTAGAVFVGFVASLASLVAVVAQSSKVLYELRRKFKDGPEDVRRLLDQFTVFQKLLNELASRLQEPQDTGSLHSLQDIMEILVHQMQEDMDDFQTIVAKIRRLLNHLDSSTIRLRIRYYLDEGTVSKYRGRLSIYIYVLTYIQSMVNEYVLNASFQIIPQY